MDEESKKLLEETLELSRENNQILQSMKRSMRLARVMSFIYWIFIIGSAVGAYYLVQPYVDSLMGAYESASETLKGFQQ